MEVRTARLTLRPWQRGDEEALVRHANHRTVWRNLADFFPHPYTWADAEAWIERVERAEPPPANLAVVRDGEPIGGIGLGRLGDLSRYTGQLGYWLGPTAWGNGYATEALRAFSEYAFEEFDLQRLQATVLEWNPASCRVLEKAGFVAEARLRKAAFKDGQLVDTWLYAKLRSA